jgi:hypothetical protein
VTRRRLLRAAFVVTLAGVAITAGLTLAGVWCPWSFVRFGGGYWESNGHETLANVACLEVAQPVVTDTRLAWRPTHRLTSPARIAAIRNFLEAHKSGWQENIFTGDTPRQMFRACDGEESRRAFVLGEETLGSQPSKNWSRPLCRRDQGKLRELLAPEA